MSFSSDIKMQRNVLIIGVVLMIVKGVAYFITGSNAILTDAIESLVNISAGAFALFSLYYAAQPSDFDHPYGHGKIEFIAGLIEGTLIAIAGLSMIAKAVYNFWHPQVIRQLEIGLILATLAGVVNFIMGYVVKKRGVANQSLVLQGEGAHLQSDGYTSFAMVAGLLIVWLSGVYWLDNVVALAMAFYICWVSFGILRKSLDGLMDKNDRATNIRVFEVIQNNRQPQWIDFHEFRVIKYGRSLHIDCHLVLPFYYTIKQEHQEMKQIEKLIHEGLAQEAEIFIHTDPCTPDFCSRCKVAGCAYRVDEFKD